LGGVDGRIGLVFSHAKQGGQDVNIWSFERHGMGLWWGDREGPPGVSFICLREHDGLMDEELATQVPGLGWG
jgi:hypothetical protein